MPDYPSHILNLDLCVLAYQLYHQSLVWPLDPWYEVIAHTGSDRRDNMMQHVQEFSHVIFHNDITIHKGDAKTQPVAIESATSKAPKAEPDISGYKLPCEEDCEHYSGAPGFRYGAPEASGHQKLLDPILTNYSRVDPHAPAFTRDGTNFIVIQAPPQVTQPIGTVKVVRQAGSAVLKVRSDPGPHTLVAFEGGTGAIGQAVTPERDSAYSLMGYVLARADGDAWDLHVVFRGSRSGSAVRAATYALDRSKVRAAEWKNVKSLVASTPKAQHETTGAKHAAGKGVSGLLKVGVKYPAGIALAVAGMGLYFVGRPLTYIAEKATLPKQRKGNADWLTDMENMTMRTVPEVSAVGQVGQGFANALRTCSPNILRALKELGRTTPPRAVYVSGHSLGAALATLFTSSISIGTFRDKLREAFPGWPFATASCTCYALPTVGDLQWSNYFNVAGTATLKHIWVTGDVVVTGGTTAFARKGGIGGYQSGSSIELEAPKGQPDNPHEVYVIRSCLLRDTLFDARIDRDMVEWNGWAYFDSLKNMLEAKENSFRAPQARPPTRLSSDVALRSMLRRSRFGNEFQRFLLLYGFVLGDKKSYKVGFSHTPTGREERRKAVYELIFRMSTFAYQANLGIDKSDVLTRLEAGLKYCDDALNPTLGHGLAKEERHFVMAGMLLYAFEKCEKLSTSDFANRGGLIGKAWNSSFGADKHSVAS
jgi:hypothetical protein